MFKIGIIISSFTNGGAQRVAITLSKWLNKHDQEAEVIELSESSKNQYDADEVNLVRLESKYKGKNITQRLEAYDQQNPTDVYIVMGVPMCMYVMPALRHSKAKIIVSERNDPRNFQGKTITKILSRYLMRRAHGYVFQTNDARAFYKKLRNSSTVIPNPIAKVPEITERRPNELRDKAIVTAGRLVEQKNQEMLIKAFSEIAEEFPEYTLVIYGEGNLKNKLQMLSEGLGIKDRVLFPGSVNDLHERILNAELFVLSSNFEGMPNALMEAMAMGITCISTDCPCGGPKDLIKDRTNGYLIQVGDTDACVKTMSECLRNKDASNKVGENALVLRNEYSDDMICKRWLEYIQSVAKIER